MWFKNKDSYFGNKKKISFYSPEELLKHDKFLEPQTSSIIRDLRIEGTIEFDFEFFELQNTRGIRFSLCVDEHSYLKEDIDLIDNIIYCIFYKKFFNKFFKAKQEIEEIFQPLTIVHLQGDYNPNNEIFFVTKMLASIPTMHKQLFL